MQIDNLSWFPGHMTKTKRMISAEIKNMDAVCANIWKHTGQVPSGCTVLRSRRLSGHRKRKQTVICWRKDSFTVCRKKESCRRIFRQDVSLFPERKEKIVFAGIIRLMN